MTLDGRGADAAPPTKDAWADALERYIRTASLRRATPDELLAVVGIASTDVPWGARVRLGMIMQQQLGWLRVRRRDRDSKRRWYEYEAPGELYGADEDQTGPAWGLG